MHFVISSPALVSHDRKYKALQRPAFVYTPITYASFSQSASAAILMDEVVLDSVPLYITMLVECLQSVENPDDF